MYHPESRILIMPRRLLGPLLVSLAVSALICVFLFDPPSLGVLYHIIMLGFCGYPLWKKQSGFSQRLQSIPLPPFFRFVLLGFCAVALEETLVGTIYTLSEGEPVWSARVSQFILFNLLAFSGFIVGWYVLLRKIKYTSFELFILAGGWGLFVERIIFYLFSNPLVGVFFMLPTMGVYMVVISPAVLSLKNSEMGYINLNFFLKSLLTFLVIFICSIPTVELLQYWRLHAPLLFPACNYIPCA